MIELNHSHPVVLCNEISSRTLSLIFSHFVVTLKKFSQTGSVADKPPHPPV